tara:strand:- start:156 stop:452 length:297 start_codon:yes stop_codon:yes gene_type:complete
LVWPFPSPGSSAPPRKGFHYIKHYNIKHYTLSLEPKPCLQVNVLSPAFGSPDIAAGRSRPRLLFDSIDNFPYSIVYRGTALNRKNLCETHYLRDHHGT